MSPYLDSVLNVMLDLSPQEWITGIILALFLALAVSGANSASRRWVKIKDETVPLTGLAIVAIAIGMVIAAAAIQLKKPTPGPPSPADMRGPGGGFPYRGYGYGFGGSSRIGNLVFDSADTDNDGMLSTDEAAAAAARFINEADSSGKGSLDRDTLIMTIRERLRPPGFGPPQPPSPPPPAKDGEPSPQPQPQAQPQPELQPQHQPPPS